MPTANYGSYGTKSVAQARAKRLKSRGVKPTIRKDRKSRVQGYKQSWTVYGKY